MDAIAACKAYAKENDDASGVALSVTLDHDVNARLEWADTWEDGVPETKLFERNSTAPLHIPSGTTLHGVAYVGRASGHTLFEFVYGEVWWRTYHVEEDRSAVFGCKTTMI